MLPGEKRRASASASLWRGRRSDCVTDRQTVAATYLHGVTSLEPAPDEDSGERNRIARGRH